MTTQDEARAELCEPNRRLTQTVADHETELRAAMAEALAAAECQARRIGEDLHDGLCQELVGLARLTASLEQQLEDPPAPARQLLDLISQQALRLARVARELSHDLTLHELSVLTLSEALETLAERTGQLFQKTVEINFGLEPDALSGDQAAHVYRIVREAVNNAVKHGRGEHIWIDLLAEPPRMIVSITNDGAPLPDQDRRADGLGMRQMRMRARLLGGCLSIRKAAHENTLVELIIPADPGEAA